MTKHKAELLSKTTKEELLSELGRLDGIIVIVAHADGFHIQIPGHEAISINPADIASTKFSGSPFVFLRVCQGTDVGFADAFLKAGAGGVWTNRGVIDVAVANRQADSFLEQIQAKATISEAIRVVMASDSPAGCDGVFTNLGFSTIYLLEPTECLTLC